MIPREKSTSDGNDITKRVVGKTKRGKEVVIDQNAQGTFFIKFTTGGALPVILRGRYMRYEIALQAVKSYLAR